MAHFELFQFIIIGLTLPHAVLCNNPPLFVNLNPTFLVPENMPQNSSITRLDAQDSDDTTLTFSVIGYPAAEILRVMRVGDKSALVLLALPLDREILDQFSVTFQVTDGVNPPIQRTCLVIVTDVNDNPPKLRNLPAKVDLSENASNGSVVYTVFATDPDTGVGGIISYELLNEQTMFQIDSTGGNITLIGKLVYVVRRTYLLHIRASDGGGLNNTADLTINVLDSQSRPPYFLHFPYQASVREDASLGYAVIQVTAYDGITGLPGQVVYSIVSGDLGFFSINASTGWITVNRVINCSNPEVLRRNGLLEVIVKASSTSATSNTDVSSWTLVSLQLIDINNNVPTFNQITYNATLLDNSLPNTLLSFNTGIVISDLDMGDNAKYRIFLRQNGLPFDAFDVIPSIGEGQTSVLIQVKNVALLNLAHTTTISFSVVAQEYLTTESFSSSATVMVSIVSQDDRAPLFQQEEYTAMIRENPQLGTFVLRATAVDQDPNSNHQITYSLRGSKASLFAVNSTTGDVFVNVDAASNRTLLDRETASAVSFMIEAINSGGLRSFAQLIVYLEDANDNLPVMTSPIYYAIIQENAYSFLFPVIIQATIHGALKSQIVYSLVSGEHLGNFAIGRDTGLVSVVIALDYETLAPGTNGAFNLSVMAANKDAPVLNAIAILRIIVQDMNDNAPRFQQPLYQVTLVENSVGGSNVINVTATDDDGTSPNNLVRYSIISGSQNKFLIDPTRGWITVSQSASLDYDTFGPQYILTVQAMDGGAPALSGTTIVNVSIIDINNKPPVFVGGKQFVETVREDAPIGTVVIQLTARDPDENNRLLYRFVDFSMSGFDGSGNLINNDSYLTDLIAVDPGTGAVTLRRALDGEKLQMLRVDVMVEDLNSQTGVKQNDTASLTLVIKRVDNEAPHFLPSGFPLTVHISDNSPPGTSVARLVAVDPYRTSNTIMYSIDYDSDASRKFEITDTNREIGIVTLKYSIYPSTFESVTLKVTATRLGRPDLNSTALLVVAIDVDSSGLRWEVFPISVSILENATVGTNVSTVTAVETISQPHGPITYSITNDVLGKFRIDNRTGLLVTSGQLSSRQMSAYHLTIAAEVVVSTPYVQLKRIFGDMTINVISTNNAPRFDQQLYTGYALTNATAGTFVVTVRAIDFDQNSILTYYIDRKSGNGSWLFDVDPITGGIFVGNSLAASAGNWFFTVLANDRGFPPLVGSAVMHVKVIDSSGNRLRIVSPPANVSLYVMQNQPAGQFVVLVKSEYIGTGGSSQIYYDLVTSLSNQDWQSFAIDHQTGVITTARVLTAGRSNYYLQVQAKDTLNEMFTDQSNLTITVRAATGDYPRFSRSRYPPPLRTTVVEGMSNIVVVNVNVADQSLYGNACYYIIGGSEEWRNKFSLDKLSGDLWLVVSLSEVQTTYVDLLVKVSDDCWSGFWELDQNRRAIWNFSDDTLLLVRVDVVGFGVGQPQLTKRSFIAGILPDVVQLEEPVLSLADYTRSGNKTLVVYSLGAEFRTSDSLFKAGFNSLQRPPFVVGHVDGVIQTNTYFQDNWNGFISFDAYVGISSHYPSDTANVTVYLLDKFQLVKVTLRDSPNEVGAIRDQFIEFLSNATRAHVGIYSIHAHKTESGGSDPTQTDMIIYAVDPSYQTVLGAMALKNLIDKKYVDERDAFNRYNVTAVMPVEDVVSPQSVSGTERSVIIAFAVVGSFLVLFLCVLCLMGCLCHKKFKRKVKAANAIAAVSDASNGHIHRDDAPGTNAYHSEGSNPVWQGTFAPNEFYNLSDSDSRNSYDENARQTSSGSQEEFLDISDTKKPNGHSKKMHFYKVNGFDESRSDSYASDGTLNQNRVRRLIPATKLSPEKEEPSTNGLATSTTNFMTPSTVV